MPLYEYQCQQCGKVTEALQKISDPPLTVCSHCSGAMKKLISSPAIQFKGSGFYINDYKKSGSSSESGSKSDSGSSSNSTSTSSSGSTSEK